MEGDPVFLVQIGQLTLGNGFDKDRLYVVQTVGGTSALSVLARFLANHIGAEIAIPTPSWPNHELIFRLAGFKIHTYPYYDLKRHQRNVEGMLQFFKQLPERTAVLLQNVCHNPTGSDLNPQEWQRVLDVFKERKLFPVFDSAYQGFAESMEKDAAALRLFAQSGLDVAIAASCSKNFGLYGERVGALLFILNEPAHKKALRSQIKQINRSIYSSPQIHGARLVTCVLSDPSLKKIWTDELANMRNRIQEMRQILASGLISKSGKPHYQFLEEQRGFFSILGISEEDVLQLRREKAIYMPLNGRINIAGLTPDNVDYIIDSLLALGP